MNASEFEYSISSRLPLSGQFLVRRSTVDRIGGKKYHSTLNKENNRWVKDASGFSYQHRFDSVREAADALAKVLESATDVTGPTIFVRKK